ncbi:electron transfer flavoprotein subunit alpha [Burkholderia singularis]|uniref:Electron transfer flavoprotein subunit alpha n=1 Tax=Burkholderia singularis TaxID=1503053 RepID=A0A118DPT0_9BURK|nr:electron transfer flavoprotein subunit alpha/FixB family protein [Burkholderia singularis]KVE28628.1 electron transfer flavoprotein subunit alpha [Burkholderia singularis]
MTLLKRIDPRRPFVVTAAGLRRITLGETGGISADAAQWQPRAGHVESAKPLREVRDAKSVLLVACHSERGTLDDHARQAIAAAALIADVQTEVVLVVFGALIDDAGALGADALIVLPDFDRRTFDPERELDALRTCAAALSPRHVFMPDDASGSGDLGRRYAAAMNASVATHVVEIDAKHVGVYTDAKRSFATRSLPDVVLLAPNAVETKLPFSGAARALAIDSSSGFNSAAGDAYRDFGIEAIDAAQVALEEADFIVSAGNGVTDIAAFEQLATAFGAAIGASRVAVDNGHFARDKQVGATGKTVEASVYIAFGISGAVQHLQGIKDCRHVIAVNLDGSAPIVKRANLTIVGDAQQTIAALTEAVGAARAANAQAGVVRHSHEQEGVIA